MVDQIAIPDILSKTPLAERVNQLQRVAPEVDQRQAGLIVKEHHVQKQREAIPTEKTDEAVIHREKPKQEQSSKEKKKQDESKKQKKSGLDLTA
jgi:hypothetical protein